MNVVAKGIDVSKYNQYNGNADPKNTSIDFNKVKADGIDFVMLRCGTSYDQVYNKDTEFDKNYKNAKAAGLLVGAYFYTYAKTVDNAVRDAKWCLQMISGKTFDYPVALDIEDSSQSKLGMTTITNMIVAFCDIIAEKYIPMVYSMDSWFGSKIDVTKITKYDVWVAHWGVSAPTYYKGTYTMFQYSEEGSVSGISGNVDLDYSYKDYSKLSGSGSSAGQNASTEVVDTYPYIIDENGDFIDPAYPNLFSPEFIHMDTSVTSNGKTVVGISESDPRYPKSGSQEIEGVTFPQMSLVIPNCVSWARTRWIQLNNLDPNILTATAGNADEWWDNVEAGYVKGQEPKLGAIACWNGGTSGHLSVVERIREDGSFFVSQSALGCDSWMTMTPTPNRRRGVDVSLIEYVDGKYEAWGSNKNLQGFIYFPKSFDGTYSPVTSGTEVQASTQVWEDLYSEPIERTDATVRTVGYFNPTSRVIGIEKSDLEVAAVNYTPVLNAIYNYNNLGKTGVTNKGYTTNNAYSSGDTNVNYSTSTASGKYKRQEIIDYLLSRGLNRAQVAGICGNMWMESSYRPWSVEGNFQDYSGRDKSMDYLEDVIKIKEEYPYTHGIGLLAWTFTPFEISMVAYCEQVFSKQWFNTLEGQLSFFLDVQLWNNMDWSFSYYAARDGGSDDVRKLMEKVPDTLDGAKQFCWDFMKTYEKPYAPNGDYEVSAHYSQREAEAVDVFNSIIPYQVKQDSQTHGGSRL